MNPFGLNVLPAPHIDRAALLAWCDRAKPMLTVVMDAPELAQTIKALLPGSIVVHRTYHKDDPRWHEVVTPKEFLDAHAPTAANGVVCQVMNEPTGAAVFAATTWIEQLITQCPPTMTLALPHFGVGNPSEDEILAGKYDRLLKAICGTRHFLALHEYLIDDPLKENPYFCGRFVFWQRRARQLGLPAPKIIITEHGRDIGGGAKDGWRDTGWSEDAYFARLVQARELYKPHGIPVAIYCYGKGYGWDSFNVEGATTLLDKLAMYQEQTPVIDIPAPTTGGVKAKLTKVPQDFINVRHQPNGNDVGDLLVGDVVMHFPDAPVIAANSRWVYQIPLTPTDRPEKRQNAAAGWVSLQDGKVVFETLVDPPPVEPEPPVEDGVTFKPSEVDAMIAATEQTLAILKGAKLPPDGTKMLLNVPFVSQLGTDADSHNNDCLVADLLMFDRYLKQQKTGVEPDLPTVDMIVRVTPLAGNPKALMTFADGIALAKRLGFTVTYKSGMMPEEIKKSLNVGAPVIGLVDYAKYNPAGTSIPHFMVITGYDGDTFVTHDPYLMGQGKSISADKLAAAMKTAPGNAGEYQALVLAA